MLQYRPGLLIDDFERAVIREASQLPVDGYVAHNVLLPDVRFRNFPNEHDVILLLPWGAYTIDAKGWWPGEYEVPANGPMRWRTPGDAARGGERGWRDMSGHRNVFKLAHQKGAIVHRYCRELRIPELEGYRIKSMIVVPDGARIVTPKHSTSRVGRKGPELDLRVVNLGQLQVELLADQARAKKSYALEHLAAILVRLEALLPVSGEGTVVGSVLRLDAPHPVEEPGCPVTLTGWRGQTVMSEVDVIVHEYRKWPPGHDTDRFMGHLVRRLKALQKLRLESVIGIVAELDLPDRVLFAYPYLEWESLKDLLRRLGRLSPELTASLVVALGRTVSRMHDAGITHLDLRPEYVQIAPALEDHRGERHRVTGLTNPMIDTRCVSTAVHAEGYNGSFCAPETGIAGHEDRGRPQGDVFSLGRIAAYCLLGDQTYRSRAVWRDLQLDDLDPRCADLIVKATHRRVGLRHRSVHEFIDAWRPLASGGSASG